LTQLKATAARSGNMAAKGENPVTFTTLIVSVALIGLFTAFAAGLVWAQQRARQLCAAPVDGARPRRRPF
jgi:hypothetical protein